MGKESFGCAASGVAKLCSQSKIDLGKFRQAHSEESTELALATPGLLGLATCLCTHNNSRHDYKMLHPGHPA